MDIYCRNVPDHVQQRHLKKALKPILAELGIFVFECQKQPRGHATITILDPRKARALLNKYPNLPKGQRKRPGQTLEIFNTQIFIEEKRWGPDPFLLRSLADEEAQRQRQHDTLPQKPDEPPKGQSAFHIVGLSCGTFRYIQDIPAFEAFFNISSPGSIKFGRTALKISIQKPSESNIEYELECDYWNLNGPIYVDDTKSSLTFSCVTPPRLFEFSCLIDKLANLFITRRAVSKESRRRIRFLGSLHEHVVSSCFTYRVTLRHNTDLRQVHSLSKGQYTPEVDRWSDKSILPPLSYAVTLNTFMNVLRLESLPYRIKYQLQMLVVNGELPIEKVMKLIPYAHSIARTKGTETAAKVFQGLPGKITYPGPHVDRSEVSTRRLLEILRDIENRRALDYLDAGKPGHAHGNQVAVHRAMVTPTGTYLSGPFLETKNRVLRRFSDYSGFFLRVEFGEESGDLFKYDPTSNLDEILEKQFKKVMKTGIDVAGRKFEFLGFSHSSLRSATCWFMAEFIYNDELLNVHSMIERLGDFKHIYSPAKYAARIGQTFSDTLTSIAVDPNDVIKAPDVKRNGRVFSDGCGTLTKEILWTIYRQYAFGERVKPTVFQIRLSGAKGMLSLDCSKSGREVMLRHSMVKFEAANDWNIEICGAGIHKLPFYLNAQIIKILEDLGVPPATFLKLQEEEVENLRGVIHSPERIAQFLEQSHISKATNLPWLIRVLGSFNLSHTNDAFLRRAVELAIIIKLRDLKYRARIKVPKAVTLYGIMDETGVLKEGEIFCPVLNEQFLREILVHKDVVITRSPALHPGDIQLADAVDVPPDSPLRRLHNCVVFSQHGSRDLPSKLSGGDLDGDIFNIIYDDRLKPTRIEKPADYPRGQEVILDRAVTKDDVIDFFIMFMNQDQLGRIATVHKIIADQRKSGTRDPDCLTLAELHSTAVDFSKTGRPVDLQRIPKFPPYRPDFMAPGPRVKIAESIELLENEEDYKHDEEDDDDGFTNTRPRQRYYRSERVLGRLYRAIDERNFLDSLQRVPKSETSSLLDRLWTYVEHETAGFIWNHHIDAAIDIQEIYEDNMRDLMRQYSDKSWKTSLTEIEVFIGNILGESHKQTRRQKDESKNMKDEYDHLVKYVVSMILDREAETESLERSIACFWVAIHPPTTPRLQSFAWVAAATCLQEVDKLQSMTPLLL